MLVDSHCHLDFSDFAPDLDLIVARAKKRDVGGMLTICTQTGEFPRVAAIAEKFENIWCSVGVHPHEVAKERNVNIEQLVELGGHPKVVGIGETGLDYYYDNSPRDYQRDSFRQHIRASMTTGLPLIIHSRDAERDTASILEEERKNGPVRGVVHCFTSGQEFAERILGLGLYISFSGILTFRKSNALRGVAKSIPLDRLLVETDAPYLTPEPHRGTRNEPEFVIYTASCLADLKCVSEADLASITTKNFFKLFDRAESQ